MATFGEVFQGMEILGQYENEDELVNAGHERFNVGGPPPDELPDEVESRLDELGWFWDEQFECWSIFT